MITPLRSLSKAGGRARWAGCRPRDLPLHGGDWGRCGAGICHVPYVGSCVSAARLFGFLFGFLLVLLDGGGIGHHVGGTVRMGSTQWGGWLG